MKSIEEVDTEVRGTLLFELVAKEPPVFRGIELFVCCCCCCCCCCELNDRVLYELAAPLIDEFDDEDEIDRVAATAAGRDTVCCDDRV